MVRLITDIKNRASGLWGDVIFPSNEIGIKVPKKGEHGPCPICGGTDRFHYKDDHDNGNWYCNQCNEPKYGDGLDLISRALGIKPIEAAKKVGKVIGADTRSPDKPARKEASDGQKTAPDIAALVAKELRKTTPKESPYLAGKGLKGFTPPTYEDGRMFLVIKDVSGTIRGYQTIAQDGVKKLMHGMSKKGAFIAPDPLPEAPETIIIAEGVATAISAGMLHSGAVVAAIDAGNLKPVALALRGRYPKAKIIIAADNDYHAPEELDKSGKPKQNTGKIRGEEAATACGGWLALPPGEVKTDWNDYHQLKGTEEAKAAFNASLVNMGEKYCTLPGGITLSDNEIEELEKLNKIYTHTQLGETTVMATVSFDQVDKTTHRFIKKETFKDLFLHEEKIAKKNKGAAWLEWPGKSMKLGGVGFYPRPEKCPDNVYNLFTGWGVAPVKGDVSPYLEHLKTVICNNNETTYSYLVGWLAHMVQRPDEKPSVAIVMKAVQGSGKGSMVNPLLKITGAYGIPFSGISNITGKFNAPAVNKILIFADEVEIKNDRDANKMKTMISEPVLTLEKKGVDAQSVPNFSRFIFASNSDRVIRAGIRERRYLVLEPSDKHAQEKEYFDALYKWNDNNGAAHLMHYLLHVDITDFDPRRAPVTDALINEMLSNLPPVEGFVYSELCRDEPFKGQSTIFSTEETDRLISYCLERDIEMSLHSARKRLSDTLRSLGIESNGRAGRGNGIYYRLPASDDASGWRAIRDAFAEKIGGNFEVVFGLTDI